MISEIFCINVVARLTTQVLFKVLPTNNTLYLVEYKVHWLMNLLLINYWGMHIDILSSFFNKQTNNYALATISKFR